MLTRPQLDAYLARIGLPRPATRSRQTLDAIAFAHVCAIPFENLDVLLGLGFSIELDAVFDKLVTRGRGGYCFEQNTLLLAALQALGFEARPLSARVRHGHTRDVIPPRTHVFVEVMLEGARWLLDVGVGGSSATAALLAEPELVQQTPHDRRRFVVEDGLWFHQVWRRDWMDVCDFTGETMWPIDRELGHWYTSTHPDSKFRSALLAARATQDGGRVALLNDRLTLRPAKGEPVVHTLENPEALLGALRRHLDLDLPPGTVLQGPPFGWLP